MPTHPHFMVN